jgi:hypothetical protein
MKIWNVRWGIHPVSPSVMLDNVDIQEADYRVWRPQYNLHAYRGIKFPQKPIDGLGRDAPSNEAEFPRPLDPVDDMPPVTVITHVLRIDGKLVVRGTTSDNGTVKRVKVNGHEAKSVGGNTRSGSWRGPVLHPRSWPQRAKTRPGTSRRFPTRFVFPPRDRDGLLREPLEFVSRTRLARALRLCGWQWV